jgi:hypothetical protein
LGFQSNRLSSEYAAEMDELRDELTETMKEKMFSAKCHSLKAYRTALIAVDKEYLRDADIKNQKNAYGKLSDGKPIPPLVSQQRPYEGNNHNHIYAIINEFSDYFPLVCFKGNDTEVIMECPCAVHIGPDGSWVSKMRPLTCKILSDDSCGENEGLGHMTMVSLMSHLHDRNTPIHSAAFAYLAFMSGDRLPDFGYRYEEHSDEGMTDCVGLITEQNDLGAFLKRLDSARLESQRIREQRAIAVSDAAACGSKRQRWETDRVSTPKRLYTILN